MPARKLYFENVRTGEELPPVTEPAADRVAVARYAGASDDYNPLHVDEEHARRAGFPGVFAHPMLAMGLLARYACEWLRGGQLRRISARFVKIVWPGDQLTSRGRVVDRRREGGEHWVDLDLWVENQRGELVVKGTATARLFHSPEDEDRQRRGLSPLDADEPPRPTLADVLEREVPHVPVRPRPKARGGARPEPRRTPQGKGRSGSRKP